MVGELAAIGPDRHRFPQESRRIMSDTSERRKQRTAEQTLRENEEQLRLLLENMEDTISRHLPDSTIIYVSPSCQSLIGYTPEELVNTRAADNVHPDDLQATLATINEAVERHDGHYRVQHRMKRKEGGYVWVETAGRLLYGPNGPLREIQCVVRDITERKRAEEALRENEDQYRTLVNHAPVVLWTSDEQGNTSFISSTVEQVYGYTPREILDAGDRLWFGRIHREDLARVKVSYAATIERGEPFDIEYRIQRRDGKWIWIRDRAIRNQEVDGRLRVDGVFSDVTDRKRAEEAQRESEERYRAIAEDMPVLVCRFLPDGEITYVNEAYCRCFQKTSQELVGRTFLSLIPETDREAVMAGISALTVESPTQSHEHPVIAPDGDIRWQRWTNRALFDAQGKPVAYQSIGEDVTERKRAEEQLRKMNMENELILSTAGEGIYGLDLNGNTTFVNPAAAKMIGWDPKELLGLNQHSVLHHTKEDGSPYPSAECPIYAAYRDGTIHRVDNEVFWRKDGSNFSVEYVSTPMRNLAGEIEGAVVVFSDISERKQAEEARDGLIAKLESQNAELERFTYTVSHDLKSPLITIKGFVGMLRQDLPEADSGPVADDLSRISNAADKMDQLLQDLLELSRIGRLINPPEDVSMDELAHEARELVHGQAEQAGVQVEISPDLPVVFGDRVRLLEVLQNLIDNAVKHMGDQSRPRVEIGSRRDGNQTVCYVRDNGIGIDPCYHEKIFGLFDQLDQSIDGSGIGLALARRIIEVHGGRIWVESEGVGHGSTFCFTIATVAESPESTRTGPSTGSS